MPALRRSAALAALSLLLAVPCRGQQTAASGGARVHAADPCAHPADRYGGAARSDTTGRAYLSSFEQAMLDALNAARTHPAAFAEHLVPLRSRFEGAILRRSGQPDLRTQEGVGAVNEAIRFLQSAEPLPPLVPSAGLSRAARDHACDQGPKGQTGHTGSDGSSMTDRMDRYGRWVGMSGENIAYGDYDPRGVVRQLIVDDGVPGRGHRDTIYKAAFRRVGLACAPHARYQRICVMNVAAGFQEAAPDSSASPSTSHR